MLVAANLILNIPLLQRFCQAASSSINIYHTFFEANINPVIYHAAKHLPIILVE